MAWPREPAARRRSGTAAWLLVAARTAGAAVPGEARRSGDAQGRGEAFYALNSARGRAVEVVCVGKNGRRRRRTEEMKRRRTATAQAIYDGQEARGNHVGVLSAPARHRGRPQSRPEADRSTPARRCRPRVLFTEITELPLSLNPKLLPNFHNNSKISKNKSCSKFKVLQLCFYNHSQIGSTF